MHKALEKAFLRLDDDLSNEALPDEDGNVNMKTLSVAMSGSVGCVAHIDGPHLHIANVGDCNAVLGMYIIILDQNYQQLFFFVNINIYFCFRSNNRNKFMDS